MLLTPSGRNQRLEGLAYKCLHKERQTKGLEGNTKGLERQTKGLERQTKGLERTTSVFML